MKIKSAYLETRPLLETAGGGSGGGGGGGKPFPSVHVNGMSRAQLDIFWRDKQLSNCQVTNLLTYFKGSTQAGINSYSDHFLTGEVIWLCGSGGTLWRINANTKDKWRLVDNIPLPYSENVSYAYRYKSGAATYATVLKVDDSHNSIVLVSRDSAGETSYCQTSGRFPPYPQEQFTPETHLDIEGISGNGKYDTSPFAPTGASANQLVSGYLYDSNYYYADDDDEHPIESSFTLRAYALQDFFGLDEDVLGTEYDPFPNRFLLSYSCSALTMMYIPIARNTTAPWTKIVASGKLFQKGTDNPLVGIGAGAVVDGRMVEVISTASPNDWTKITADLHELPYVDYIIIYGNDGSQALREIKLIRDFYSDAEEY